MHKRLLRNDLVLALQLFAREQGDKQSTRSTSMSTCCSSWTARA